MNGPLDLVRLVKRRRIIVCCGSGGVGKTTSAAALGVLAAQEGVNALVMTIDPARRLAQAMGLDALGHLPQNVALDAPGRLSAMMLDSKRAFDRLVDQLAPDERVREAIFANRYYQQISTALGGSRELVAMERVLEAVAEGGYELLIVDTPPSQHALDFLDAPARIVSLLDGSMTSMLLRPYGIAARAQFRLFQQSSNAALKFFERLTGVQMFADLSEFLLAFSGLFDGFRERSHQVQALMRDPATCFLLVCAPEPASLRQVDLFATRLRGDRMDIAGMIANRVHRAPEGPAALELTSTDTALLEEALGGDGAARAQARLVQTQLTNMWDDAWNQHRANIAALDSAAADAGVQGGLPRREIPDLGRAVSGMADLLALAGLLRRPDHARSF